MILDKSQQLIELSGKKIELQEYANNLQGFQSRHKQIEKAVTELQPLVGALKAFRQKGLTTFDLTQKADALLRFIAETEANFQNNPNWIIPNDNFQGSLFEKSIKGLTDALKQQLTTTWISYRTQQTPITNAEMLKILEQVRAFSLTVQRIRQLNSQIQQLDYPKSSEDFDRVEGLINQLRQLWHNLSSDEVPVDVLRFLKAAANEGATLDLLTPAVKDWLTARGIAASLRIRLI